MGILVRTASVALAIVSMMTTLIACEREEGGRGRYSAHGIVEDVDKENAQVLIDHEDVEGLMPAMTMNFAVPDKRVLAKLESGQLVDFVIHFTGRSFDVVEVDVVGVVAENEGWIQLRDGLVRTSPAPPFDLIDQAGRRVSLKSLNDLILMVDFIYTSCRGPCPVQTSLQVALQRRIPEALREHVHFISISLDPEVDRPEVLERYAADRGADFSNWSFLTGPTEEVAEVIQKWGVGSIRKPDGTIDHTLVRFLVHNGRVVERYWTSDGTDEEISLDLRSLAENRAAANAMSIDIHP